MKQTFLSIPCIALALFGVVVASAAVADSHNHSQEIYPATRQKIVQGSADYFTGDVSVKMLFPSNETAHYSGAYVTFQPGARSAWHDHPAGQHIIVTEGVGLTGTADGKVTEISEGDAIWCPPGVRHWHGAAPDTAMTHLVVTASKDGKNVVWHEHVTDEQYNAN